MKKKQLESPISLRVWCCVAVLCSLLTIAITPLNAVPSADQAECQALKKDASITAANGTSVVVCNRGEKLHLYSNMGALQGNYIEFTQGSLEEVAPDGEVVRNIKLDGSNTWSPVAEADGIFSTVYSAQEKSGSETLADRPLRFDTLLTFGTLVEAQQQTGQCAACAADSSGACAVHSGQCDSEVTTEQDILQFGFRVSNWEFQDPANRLRYRMDLKTREDTDFFNASAGVHTDIDLSESGLIAVADQRPAGGPYNVVQSVFVDVSVDQIQQNKLNYQFSVEAYPADHEFL